MLKTMIFIDGTWIFRSLQDLVPGRRSTRYKLDYGALPLILKREMERQTTPAPLDVVRVHIFGSLPTGYDPIDEAMAASQRQFYKLLETEYSYAVETYELPFKGRRLRKSDRAPDDPFNPQEKCVDVALATAVLYYATIHSAYDIALVVTGDRDYVPALKRVRDIGKRVAIASIKDTCAAELIEVVDYPMIWLSSLVEDLRFDPHHEVQCQSKFHVGSRTVKTRHRPQDDQAYVCQTCRRRQRQPVSSQEKAKTDKWIGEFLKDFTTPHELLTSPRVGTTLQGTFVEEARPGECWDIWRIKADNGEQYHFIASLEKQILKQLRIRDRVEFEIHSIPGNDNRGKFWEGVAQRIRHVSFPVK